MALFFIWHFFWHFFYDQDDWSFSTPGETYDINTEFLRAVHFFQEASKADRNGGERGVFRLSRLSHHTQAEIFHDVYDLLYGLEPYESPHSLVKWGLGGIIGAFTCFMAIIYYTSTIPESQAQAISINKLRGVLAGSILAGVVVAEGLDEYLAYDSHISHWYTYSEIMAIETAEE